MIRLATYEDLPQLANILRQAFDANPAVNDTIKNDEHRDKRAFALMEYVIKNGLLYHGVYINSEKNCAAVMYNPNQKVDRIKSLIYQIQLVHRAISWSRAVYMTKKDKLMRAQRPSGDHLYLQMIGTLPEAQGTGAGTEMLKYLMQQSTTLALDLYLETSVEKNVKLYEKRGWKVYHIWDVRPGYVIHFMKRAFTRESVSE